MACLFSGKLLMGGRKHSIGFFVLFGGVRYLGDDWIRKGKWTRV